MPYLNARDGTRLYYEEAGSGTPIVFVHEFGGDGRSWEPQMRHFTRRYRCISFCARGYPPSDVPDDVERYSQAIAADADLYELGLTSHASVNLMLALEDEFDIEFPDDALNKTTFATIASIERAVGELTAVAA